MNQGKVSASHKHEIAADNPHRQTSPILSQTGRNLHAGPLKNNEKQTIQTTSTTQLNNYLIRPRARAVITAET